MDNLKNLDRKIEKLYDIGLEFAPKIAAAIIVLVAGLYIINKLVDLIGKAMEHGKISEDVRPFLKSLAGVMMKVMLLFSAAGIVGIETTSFVAVLAAAGFAVGMALQGSLSNFAAGVMILIFKPFRVNDVVDIQGQMGHIKEIEIFNTIVRTFDNKIVIVPNGIAIGDVITNFSTNGYLRIEMSVAMPYEEDFKRVQRIIQEALLNTPKVLQTPAPIVGIDEFESHNIKLAIWPYANTEDYWEVYFEAKQNVFQALADNNVKMAYSEGVELGRIGAGPM